jgi:hypothetical protein
VIKFNWKWPNGRRHARIRIEHVIDPEYLALALICIYSRDHDADELPTDLKRAQVDRAIRDLYANRGSTWCEGGAYDDVELGETEAFEQWAGDTIRRCYPEVAVDPELAKFGTR